MFCRSLCCCAVANPVTWEKTIPFVPPITKGIVIKVYDGDTITLASRLPYSKSPMYRFRVRLTKIDAPEIKTKDKNEKKMAEISRDKLAEKILNKKVKLMNVNTEKYGRVLADVYCDGICMSDWMLSQNLAVPYDGGKKTVINWKSYLRLHTK